jgi:hypothetical protein
VLKDDGVIHQELLRLRVSRRVAQHFTSFPEMTQDGHSSLG